MNKVLGAFSRFLRPKTKQFAVEFRRILEVLCLQGSQTKLWAHFRNLCVQKWSCFLRSSDAFWRLSPCEVYDESSGRNITIFTSTNEAVCREVQTHFQRSPFARFTKQVMGSFSLFMCPKTKLLAVKFRRILDVLCLQVLQKSFWAHLHDLCVQKRSSLPWSSDGFWKFSPWKLRKKDMGAFSRFLRTKMKLFALEFRRILEVFAWWGLWKTFWAHFHDLCVQKWSCFLRSSDAIWKFSPCEVYKKVLGALSRFMCPKKKLLAAMFRRILDVFTARALWR